MDKWKEKKERREGERERGRVNGQMDGWMDGWTDRQIATCGKYTNFLPDFPAAITPPNAICKHWVLYSL